MRLLCVFFCLVISLAAESAFYVAPDGDDSRGDGSSAKPWATITMAARKMPDEGGRLIVRPGVYQGPVRISRQFRNWLIVESEKPYRARLRHDKAVLLINISAKVEVRGFEIFRTPPTGTPEPLLAHISHSESIVLRNNVLHDSYQNDILKINEEAHDILISGNVFYNQEGPAGQHIDVNGCRDVFITENIFFNDFAGTGVAGEKTHGFLVMKNSGEVPESRRILVARNVFLNFEGSAGSNMILLGEDGKPFHETQDVLIENNLLIGNSPVRMRSPLGFKGVRDIIVRNNTITGDLPASSFVARINLEGRNAVNQNLQFINNVWSTSSGRMESIFQGLPSESRQIRLENNMYWNGSRPIPQAGLMRPSLDRRQVLSDPQLPWAKVVTLPRWEGEKFRSGTTSIPDEFRRLVQDFGMPPAGSSLIGRANTELAPADDIRGAIRGPRTDLGAAERGGTVQPLRVLLMPGRVMGGVETTINRIVLSKPAPSGGVSLQLATSNASIAALPIKRVTIPEGADSVSFAIKTSTVNTDTPVTVTASSAAAKSQAELTVVPEGVVSINPRAYTLPTGQTDHYLMLEGPAAEGTKVVMTSSRPDLVSFPRVEVPAGKSWASFTVQCRALKTDTPVKLIASLGNSSRKETVLFHAGQAIVSVKLSTTHAFNGAPVTATINVSEPAASGQEVLVNLRSERPDLAIVPASVRVPPGQTSVDVPIQTKPAPGRKSVGIQAMLNGTDKTEWVVIGLTEPLGVDLYPTRSNKTTGLVRLSAPAPAGYRCTLVSSRPDLAAVPESVTADEGSYRAQFEVRLNPGYDQTNWNVSATCAGIKVTGTLAPR